MPRRFLAAALSFCIAWSAVPAEAAQLAGSLGAPAGGPKPVVALALEGAVSAEAPAPSLLTPGISLPEPVLAPAPMPAPAVETAAALGGLSEPAVFAESADAAYDGQLSVKSAATTAAPETPGRMAAPLPPSTPHKNAPKPSRVPWFRASLMTGAAAAVLAPVITRAVPVDYLQFSAWPALIVAAGVIGAALTRYFIRKVLETPRAEPPRRSRLLKTAVLSLGLISGIAAGSSATVFKADIVEYQRSQEQIMRAPPSMARETMAVLSQSEEGRQLLERLEDIFGVPRPPTFFISNQDDSMAYYNSVENIVVIDVSLILARGWSEEQFLKDPALQRRLIGEIASTMIHELRHADQARRSLKPTWFEGRNAMEPEYEAFTTEMLFIHQMLQINPLVNLDAGDIRMYEKMIADYDGYLQKRDESPAYKDNIHIDTPYYREYFKTIRAGMPKLSVDGYVLLAKRALPADPAKAAEYLKKAQDRAAAHNLPKPELLIPAKN